MTGHWEMCVWLKVVELNKCVVFILAVSRLLLLFIHAICYLWDPEHVWLYFSFIISFNRRNILHHCDRNNFCLEKEIFFFLLLYQFCSDYWLRHWLNHNCVTTHPPLLDELGVRKGFLANWLVCSLSQYGVSTVYQGENTMDCSGFTGFDGIK